MSTTSGSPTVLKEPPPTSPPAAWNLSRPKIPPEVIEEAVVAVVAWLKYQIQQKGDGAYASPHEALGVIQEEFDEFKVACHNNDPHEFVKEAIDIAVGAIWAVASNRKEYERMSTPMPPDDKRGAPLPAEEKKEST